MEKIILKDIPDLDKISVYENNGGPGFKRYMGTISVDVGLNIYPDVKKVRRK